MIGQTVSHYVVREKLGHGGMGVVYKAEDTRLKRPVALKFLSPDLEHDAQAIERFEREARAASGLNHPNICAVHDIGEHAGRHFIVMELLEGTPLDLQVGGGPLATDRIVELGIQLADALQAAHAQGLLHRDVKPANVFVTTRGQAKLLDFGLAKPHGSFLAGAESTQGLLTGRGEVLGTVAFMSPEQVRGEALDVRTDLFSLGAVLYEMATGKHAFAGATSGTVQDMILNRPSIPAGRVNPELPPRLEDIINKALEKDRSLRYQTAADLQTDLLRVKRDLDSARLSVGSATAGPDTRARWAKTRPALLISATALVALTAAGAWFALSRPSGEAIESVAVLPFVNSSGNPETEYLSDGITESLINNLSQFPTLRVSARSTVFRYKGQQADPQKVGKDLNVRAVLSGRLLQRGDMLVLRTELMDVANGSQLWGHEYTRRTDDVFGLQEELSTEISERLRLRLTNEDRDRLTKRSTQDPEVYRLYLQGRYHWYKRTPEGTMRAAEYLRQAIDKDPRYALAYAALADAYNSGSFFNVVPPRELMEKAKAAGEKALAIDDELAEAHAALGYASFTYDWDWTAATKHFDRALALDATIVSNYSYYPFYLTVGGHSDEAIRVAKRALDRDPVSAALSHNLAVQLILAKQYDAAIEECRRTIDLDPGFGIAYEVMAGAYAAKGRYQEALPLMARAVEINPANAFAVGQLGSIRGRLGQRPEALHVLDQLTRAANERYVPALAYAVVHVGLGNTDLALDWLDKAYEERSNRLAYLGLEPVWEPLRSDARFNDLLRRIGLPR